MPRYVKPSIWICLCVFVGGFFGILTHNWIFYFITTYGFAILFQKVYAALQDKQ
ncbi:hypothetical protein [Absicoccus porci]|uniref:hypothetical protein n=1 Tax=Absicoccus porci TaxID=2486576 RepID=UPI001605EE98|nr:hypothetical protein [Absicoccus porci]